MASKQHSAQVFAIVTIHDYQTIFALILQGVKLAFYPDETVTNSCICKLDSVDLSFDSKQLFLTNLDPKV